jgi:hypothetical protein
VCAQELRNSTAEIRIGLYQRLEGGAHSLNLETLSRLAQVFETDEREFLK